MMLAHRRGSVLMEFVIMMPIYLILIGFAFFSGELMLHGIMLTASADRTLVGDVAETGERSDRGILNKLDDVLSPTREEDHSGKELEYSDVGAREAPTQLDLNQYAVRAPQVGDFTGQWSRLVVALVTDDYALTPFTRSLLMFWAHNEKHVDMVDNSDALDEDSAAGQLLKEDKVGRAKGMTGKDLYDLEGNRARYYGYYMLQRGSVGRVSYRTWDALELVRNSNWEKRVHLEPLFGVALDDPKSVPVESFPSMKGKIALEIGSAAEPNPGSGTDSNTYAYSAQFYHVIDL